MRPVLTLTIAISSLLIVNVSGASAQIAVPTTGPVPTAAVVPTATTTNGQGTSSSTSSGTGTSTSTSTEVRSPTSTSTQATTTGNVTVTGGAGNGDTTVNILPPGQPGAAVSPGTAGPSGIACQYKLGFADLQSQIPAIVGDCLTDESHNVLNGDGLQNSAGGLMVWRKADNWTAFTDGTNTWINGPDGVQQRLNTQRYSWEANPDNLPTLS
jgi:hypothetical protein